MAYVKIAQGLCHFAKAHHDSQSPILHRWALVTAKWRNDPLQCLLLRRPQLEIQ